MPLRKQTVSYQKEEKGKLMSGGVRPGRMHSECTMLRVADCDLQTDAGWPNTLSDISLCSCLAESCMLVILTFST